MNTSAHKAISSLRTVGSHQDIATKRANIQLSSTGETIELRDPSHVTMHSVAGWTVRALSGTVWLTQDGDVRDIVLEAGQSFTFDRPGPALLSALGEAKIRVCRPAGAKQSTGHSALRELLHRTAGAKATFA